MFDFVLGISGKVPITILVLQGRAVRLCNWEFIPEEKLTLMEGGVRIMPPLLAVITV